MARLREPELQAVKDIRRKIAAAIRMACEDSGLTRPWRGSGTGAGAVRTLFCARAKTLLVQLRCPECGRNTMKYNRYERLYVCASCGVMMTLDEVLDRREAAKARHEPDKYDYLEWWLSSKRGKRR